MKREEYLQEFFGRQKIRPDSRTARISRRAGEFMWEAALHEQTKRENKEQIGVRATKSC